MSKRMLGRVLLSDFQGPRDDLEERVAGKNGAKVLADFKLWIRGDMMPIPLSAPTSGVTIVKSVVVPIGGGRTTDKIIAAAWELPEELRLTYINEAITQANMPSGYGPERSSLLEFGNFGRVVETSEVWAWQTEPGHNFPTYGDGLRFQEEHPEAQLECPHIFIPEAPYCDADGYPQALFLWGHDGKRKLGLSDCRADLSWDGNCVFARRKVLGSSDK